MTYFLLLGGQYGLDYFHKYLEREEQALQLELNTSQLKTQLAHAQLSALKMQLHPRFFVQHFECHHGAGSPAEGQTSGGDAIPICPNALPSVPKPYCPSRPESLVLNNLGARQSAVTRLDN